MTDSCPSTRTCVARGLELVGLLALLAMGYVLVDVLRGARFSIEPVDRGSNMAVGCDPESAIEHNPNTTI